MILAKKYLKMVESLMPIGIWFLCLMAYQFPWVISYQSYLCRRTTAILFDPNLGEQRNSYRSQECLSDSEDNSVTGVRIRSLRSDSLAL